MDQYIHDISQENAELLFKIELKMVVQLFLISTFLLGHLQLSCPIPISILLMCNEDCSTITHSWVKPSVGKTK